MKYLEPILKELVGTRVGEILVNSGLIKKSQLNAALETQKQTGEKLGEILIRNGYITKRQLTNSLKYQLTNFPEFKTEKEALSYIKEKGISKNDVVKRIESYYGLSYVDLMKTEITPDLFSIFDFDSLKEKKIMPFAYDKATNTISFAMAGIDNRQLKESVSALCRQKGFNTRFFFAFAHEIEKKHREIKGSALSVINIDEGGAREWVDDVLKKGINFAASDIHIEPKEKGLQVRYRVDGVLSLKENYNYSEDFIQSITARAKIISGMNIAERRRPQDGRIDNYEHNGRKYDFRVSTVSTINGEKIVMRLFDRSSRIVSFRELGFCGRDEEKIKEMLAMPYGIIYLAGATGSGKTTTLYTMIDHVSSDKINIYTIEDPVEKTLKEVNQIQVNPQSGITFAGTLRALLRQDPDVIVVGEIRDQETADLSVRSSLTGHLVLSTIHANNAVDSISRLFDMGIESYLVGASTLGIISQRLVRKLCPHCKQEATPDCAEEKWLNRIEKTYCLPPAREKLYRPRGCPECNNLGYKGRIAVAEVLTVSGGKHRELITRKNTETLQKMALEEGFIPMELNAYKKVLDGTTSVEEAMRVF